MRLDICRSRAFVSCFLIERVRGEAANTRERARAVYITATDAYIQIGFSCRFFCFVSSTRRAEFYIKSRGTMNCPNEHEQDLSCLKNKKKLSRKTRLIRSRWDGVCLWKLLVGRERAFLVSTLVVDVMWGIFISRISFAIDFFFRELGGGEKFNNYEAYGSVDSTLSVSQKKKSSWMIEELFFFTLLCRERDIKLFIISLRKQISCNFV